MRRLLTLLLLAGLGAVVPAAARTVDVVAPAAGARLHGGSIAFVEWKAGELPADAEEWEAFLSIDGGRYYGWRITPHLDIELRRFSFVVPNVDTARARILIRAGDETHETRFELPQTFTIVHDARIAAERPTLLSLGKGESAREGDPAVVGWVDGARNGSALASRSARAEAPVQLAVVPQETSERAPAVAPHSVTSIAPPATTQRRAFLATRIAAAASQPRSRDLLLVCRRRNV